MSRKTKRRDNAMERYLRVRNKFGLRLLLLVILAMGVSSFTTPSLVTVHAQSTSVDFELPEFYNTCTDSGRKILNFNGGACGDQSQFSQSSDSFTYFHKNATGPYTKDCTAVFSGLPADLTIKYRQEDGITQNGSGMARLEEVCWLLAIRPT